MLLRALTSYASNKKYVGPSAGLTCYPSLQNLDSAARSIWNREDDKTQFSTALKTILSKLSKLVGNWLAKLTPHHQCVASSHAFI